MPPAAASLRRACLLHHLMRWLKHCFFRTVCLPCVATRNGKLIHSLCSSSFVVRSFGLFDVDFGNVDA